MNSILSLAISVAANILSYFVCKWLDKRKWQQQPDKPNETPGSPQLPGVSILCI